MWMLFIVKGYIIMNFLSISKQVSGLRKQLDEVMKKLWNDLEIYVVEDYII